jgi:predicted transcriptional regulator
MKGRALDYKVIAELHNQGLKVVEIADRLKTTKGAVSKALKKMDRDVTRCVMPAAVQQFEKKVQVQDHLLFFLNDYMQEFKRLNDEKPPSTAEEFGAWLSQKLALGAESRKVVSTLSDICYRMFQAEEVAEILRIIDEEIGNESIECQKRIRDRIERRRAVRFPAIPH